MGFDLVAWAPSVTTGTNTVSDYNIPGSTFLDNSVDTTHSPTEIMIGDASMFPAILSGNPPYTGVLTANIPTIAQINSSSGFNQIAAAINRRILMRAMNFNVSYAIGTPAKLVPYFVSGNKLTTTLVAAMRTAINAVRGQEGFLSYTFSSISVGSKILGKHLAEMRQALRISGTASMSVVIQGWDTYYGYQAGQYTRIDHPYGSLSSEVIQTNFFDSMGNPESTSQLVGKVYPAGGANIIGRYREYFQWPIPDYAAANSSFSAQVQFSTGNNFSGSESYTGLFYSSSTDDSSLRMTPTGGGFMYNLNFLDGSWTGAIQSPLVSYPSSRLQPFAGKRFCMIGCTDKESTGTGSATQSGGTNLFSGFPAGDGPTFNLIYGS